LFGVFFSLKKRERESEREKRKKEKAKRDRERMLFPQIFTHLSSPQSYSSLLVFFQFFSFCFTSGFSVRSSARGCFNGDEKKKKNHKS
jgi:hypothetical protein